MTATSQSVLASLAMQWAISLLMAWLVWRLNARARRPALDLVAFSWLAFSGVFLGSAIGLWGAFGGLAPWHPLRWFAATLGQVAGYLQAALLLLGMLEVSGRRAFRPATTRLVLAAAVVAGLVTPLLFLLEPDAAAQRYLVRFGVRSLVIGVAFAYAGSVLWRRREPGAVGRRLVAAAFLAYGAEMVHYFGLACWHLVSGRLPSYEVALGFADFFLLVTIGLGTVVWMLEVERERTLSAIREVDQLANFDPTTGLPNRAALVRRLSAELDRAVDSGSGVGLLTLDVDGFRAVNDSLGPGAGDRVLGILAQRLRDTVPTDALVARIGSDEFAVLLPATGERAELARTTRRLRGALRSSISLPEQELFVTASIGAALGPADGTGADDLLRAAEAALHASQQQGRDGFLVYSSRLESLTADRLRFESHVREAVEDQQFVLHYQPILGLDSRRVVACEALLRWPHPGRGLLTPEHFLAVVESIGALPQLEWWILATACRQLRRWRRDGYAPPILSVNLSPQRFQHHDTVERAARVAADASVDPRSIQLEITERSALPQTELTLRVLWGLKRHGFRIAIDDFGSGYSSLALLRTAPIDCLKLDGGFIRSIDREPREAAFVSAIVAVAHGLGIPVVAECVERESQRDTLWRLDCDAAQGFLFGPALEPDAIADLVRSNGAAPTAAAGR